MQRHHDYDKGEKEWERKRKRGRHAWEKSKDRKKRLERVGEVMAGLSSLERKNAELDTSVFPPFFSALLSGTPAVAANSGTAAEGKRRGSHTALIHVRITKDLRELHSASQYETGI
jgi:hypothetical protein